VGPTRASASPEVVAVEPAPLPPRLIRAAGDGRLIGIALFLLAVFPYVSPVPTPFDTQPYALLAAAVVLGSAGHRHPVFIPGVLVPFAVVVAIAAAQILARGHIADTARSFVGYLSIPIISLAAFTTFKHVRAVHLVVATQAWLFFGLMQAAISKTFGSFLLPRLSTSSTRGVTSLAVEPSYYAVVCIFFLVLSDVLYSDGRLSRRQHVLILTTSIVQILLARAGLGILLLFIYLFAKLISQARIGQLIKGATGLTLGVWVFVRAFQDIRVLKETRVGRQLEIALSDPISLLTSDGSAADRLGHVLISHLCVLDHPLGFGPGNWYERARELAAEIGGFTYRLAQVNLSVGNNRIMSGWGAGFFELGAGGFLLLGAFFVLMARGWARSPRHGRGVYVSSAITIYFVMLMAVPLAFPLFGYTLGVFASSQYPHRRPDGTDALGDPGAAGQRNPRHRAPKWVTANQNPRPAGKSE
jgi:hypothetical protein